MTITLDDAVYEGLYRTVGKRHMTKRSLQPASRAQVAPIVWSDALPHTGALQGKIRPFCCGSSSMRLTQHERDVIRSTAHEIFGPDARVCLFGSRTDDSLRGGDIDLLIDLPNPQTEARRKSLTLAARLQMRIGDQPIDVLVIDPLTRLDAIHRIAKANAQTI